MLNGSGCVVHAEVIICVCVCVCHSGRSLTSHTVATAEAQHHQPAYWKPHQKHHCGVCQQKCGGRSETEVVGHPKRRETEVL